MKNGKYERLDDIRYFVEKALHTKNKKEHNQAILLMRYHVEVIELLERLRSVV